ncbi:hypothetical protein B0E33_19085 [Roseibium algicola]|uniref:Uncharacterized protein n=1 Tax=Roseibium algicola TaxID=2857014 RepID=A0ABN4X6D6_9HYPH|nr:hypothetical protein [Roseibium aggregatum]AQQ07523.1 hypothetical protein B0E33_19085 [Roseibium aggregatum]
MPVTITPIQEKDCWSGSTWTIEDENELAALIARVAIGQSRVVERVLRATGDLPHGYPKGGFDGARKLLSVAKGDKSYHRDGWVFQVIAWIAAHRFDDEALIRAPQMIMADKGLDGLIIEFDGDGIARVVICEEKATEHPRQKVQSAVWPEFEEFETGARDNELVASVTSLLDRSGDPDPDHTVANILWEEKRAYRVAVTVGENHSSQKGRKRLFKDYETKVLGNVDRRRAETLFLKNVRKWINDLAQKALAEIDAAEAAKYV